MRVHRHSAPRSASSNRFAAAPLYAALLAAAVLSACSSSSAWRSSSAMTSDRAGGKVAAAAGPARSEQAGQARTAQGEPRRVRDSSGQHRCVECNAVADCRRPALPGPRRNPGTPRARRVRRSKADTANSLATVGVRRIEPIGRHGCSRLCAGRRHRSGRGAARRAPTRAAQTRQPRRPNGQTSRPGHRGQCSWPRMPAWATSRCDEAPAARDSDSSLSAAQSDAPQWRCEHAATEQDPTGTAGGAQAGTAASSEGAAPRQRTQPAQAQQAAERHERRGSSGSNREPQAKAARASTRPQRQRAASAGQASSGASEGGAALSRERAGQQDRPGTPSKRK